MGARWKLETSKLTAKWSGAPYKPTILYIGPSVSFHSIFWWRVPSSTSGPRVFNMYLVTVLTNQSKLGECQLKGLYLIDE